MKAIYKDKVIAESDKIVKVEGNFYFPPDSVKENIGLEKSPTPYTCPWKGEAQYWHVTIDGEKIEDGAWSYPEPEEAAKEIAKHLAFDLSKGITVLE